MLFSSSKTLCSACNTLFHWLAGLSLLVVGVLGLLQQLEVLKTSPWGWAWPVIALVWGLLVLFNVGCKDCSK